jgi:Arc/MetJ-type ribon-helix-helix transcriptional regulator
MGTWSRFTVNFGPESYRKLLLRLRVLQETKSDLSRAGAVRYTLRRLQFQADQKRAYARAVRRELEGEEDRGRVALIVDELAGESPPDPGTHAPVLIPVPLRLDPWSMENLRLRHAVLRARRGERVTRSEALRRIFRRRQFTEEQRRRFGPEVLDRLRREEPEAFAELDVEAAAVG